jgi:topoisomerase-4 subunit B
MADLFKNMIGGGKAAPQDDNYSAKHIEVLEGLEPVRRRPGMYIGGTDERALHHLVAEVIDNSMDEAVAGHANRIEMELHDDGSVTVQDNGRGIPVDPHPKFPDKSALEVILTTLHSGGKFSDKVYATSGGLHGVGLSVVNALCDRLTVDVARDKRLYRQEYSRGEPLGEPTDEGAVSNRRGTTIRFHPDPNIFGESAAFSAARLYRMARSKAYLYRGVEIRWKCDPSRLPDDEEIPATASLHFPGGLADFLQATIAARHTVTPTPFAGEAAASDGVGKVEWAITWPEDGDGFLSTYCNTVPTPQGGNHEAGLRMGLVRGLKTFGEMAGNKKAAQILAEDIVGGACAMLSVFIRDPQFQGQTKEKLSSPEASRLVEQAMKDRFELWLAEDPASANLLLERIIERVEERIRRRSAKDLSRKTAARRLRLPGKLADCSRGGQEGTELFIVEGDSAGGSAKQARDRETQAILPLRGKILNVASATADKLAANQELTDLAQALGCGLRGDYDDAKLRYDKVIIMTDADVDGAHISALLMTFFYREMPTLIENGHLYLALPPLYKLAQGAKTAYARDDAHRDELLANEFAGKGKIETSRFKGLGEMNPKQLRDTTMAPGKRLMLRVDIPDQRNPEEADDARQTKQLVESLMGRKPELRLAFIQEHARFVEDIDV